MYLTEQQIEQREDMFFQMAEEFTELMYDVPEDYQMTEEDAYISSIILDYFVENYVQPSLKESATMALTDTDINDALYEEIYDALMDESIGSFVAGAVHGLKNMWTKGKAKLAQSSTNRAAATSSDLAKKSKAAAKTSSAFKGTGISGAVKSGFYKAKADKLSAKSAAAKLAHSQAQTNRNAAQSAHKSSVAKRTKLATKIDTGIANVKNKVKDTIHRGAGRLGSFIGRISA